MVYTIAKFREQLREAFNMAEQGKKVVIQRYGKQYRLIDESRIPTEARRSSKNLVEAKDGSIHPAVVKEPVNEL